MTKNATYCDKHVSSRKCIFFVVIKAIERMRKPARLRDVQKFTGCLASVSRFLSRLGERALPLYQLMKKTSPFE